MAEQNQTPRTGPRADQVEAADLSKADQEKILESDSGDTAKKAEAPKLTGKRVRAIPAVITKSGDTGTTIEIPEEAFRNNGVEHPAVKFDYRHDNFTLAVGNPEKGELSEEAAELLTKNWPTSFEYMDQG